MPAEAADLILEFLFVHSLPAQRAIRYQDRVGQQNLMIPFVVVVARRALVPPPLILILCVVLADIAAVGAHAVFKVVHARYRHDLRRREAVFAGGTFLSQQHLRVGVVLLRIQGRIGGCTLLPAPYGLRAGMLTGKFASVAHVINVIAMLYAYRILLIVPLEPAFAAILAFIIMPAESSDQVTFFRGIRILTLFSPLRFNRNILVRAEVHISAFPADALFEIMRCLHGYVLCSTFLPFVLAIEAIVIDCAHAAFGVTLVVYIAVGTIAPAHRDIHIFMGTCLHISTFPAFAINDLVILAFAGQLIIDSDHQFTAAGTIERRTSIARHDVVVGRRIAVLLVLPVMILLLRVVMGALVLITARLAYAIREPVTLSFSYNLACLFIITIVAIQAPVAVPAISGCKVSLCIAVAVRRIIKIKRAAVIHNPLMLTRVATLTAYSIVVVVRLLHALEHIYRRNVPFRAANLAGVVRSLVARLDMAVGAIWAVLYDDHLRLIRLRMLACIAAERACALLVGMRLIGFRQRFRGLHPGYSTGKAGTAVPAEATHDVILAVLLRIGRIQPLRRSDGAIFMIAAVMAQLALAIGPTMVLLIGTSFGGNSRPALAAFATAVIVVNIIAARMCVRIRVAVLHITQRRIWNRTGMEAGIRCTAGLAHAIIEIVGLGRDRALRRFYHVISNAAIRAIPPGVPIVADGMAARIIRGILRFPPAFRLHRIRMLTG